MIFFTFLYQVLSMSASQIDKTIYLIEGEEYKVNLDSFFNEINENTYSFESQNKGFTLDTSNLKLKSDQGSYSIQPTKILRQRQLVNMGDYQGTGQFGILDEYNSGHRICYNSDAIINLDQCIELDNTATSYDFVFIAKDTIAVSSVRVTDQQFGVTIYQNKEIISEFYFVPSKTYTQVTSTILEYSIFGQKKYLLFGVTELDSNIEFLEIQLDLTLKNTNKVIDQLLLPVETKLQVYDIRGALNKVFVVCQSNNQAKLVITVIFENTWTSSNDYLYSYDFRGLELGYSFIYSAVTESYLECEQDYYNIRSKSGGAIFNNLFTKIKLGAQVKYTINYFIVLQDNRIIVSTFQKLAQRSNIIAGTILKIDVDFQNDVLIVFTDTQILTYYLKQATLQYQSNTITKSLDTVTIKAVAGQNEQIANINFQVLSKQDYNLYLLKDLTQDLYSNRVFYSPNNNIPITGISGADIKVDGQVDDQVQIIPKYLNEYGISTYETVKKTVILEQLLTNSYNPFLFRQFDDFSFSLYDCRLAANAYQCTFPVYTNQDQKQRILVQYHQVGTQSSQYALLNEDGLNINIYIGSELKSIIQTFAADSFVNFKVGTDRLFAYTVNYYIFFYQLPSGEIINQLDLSQYGQPQGEILRNLWINQYKSNLIVIAYGEELIIGRFTSQFRFIQRIKIQWVIDVAIIADNKFIVLSTDKTNKQLTLYILEDGLFRVSRVMDAQGYEITGYNILIDYVYAEITIQAQKDQQKALLVFGDTELARNSLLKVIQLEDDESAVNVIYNSQFSSLLKKSTDIKKNSKILDLPHRQQEVETSLIKFPNKFSQSLDLKYIFTSSFSQNKVETMKNLYLEYQFYNLTAKQNSDNIISYKKENQIQIPVKQDTFQGQVRTISLTSSDVHLKLTTRFKNNKKLAGVPESSKCKQVVSFSRLICFKGTDVTYHDSTGKILSQVSVKSLTTTDLKQLILHNDELYALVQSTGQLMLIYISQNEIKQSQAFFQWENPLDISIFYKGWLLVYYSTYLGYYQFQSLENDLWKLDKVDQFFTFGIVAIQYDPITQQIFYSTGYQNLYYFKSSLEGTSLNKEDEYFLNIGPYLKTQKIYQVQTRIENIKIISQYQKSYLFLSTSYGNILNMTIKSATQEFQINNMYIVNGPSSTVQDIQIIDDYVLVQNQGVQFLYKNTHDWSLDKPYLILEEIAASNLMGLFKNGSQIIHLYGDQSNIYQSNIDDDVYITISDLKSYTPGNILIRAYNGYGQALVDFLTIQLADDESSSTWIWVVISIVAVIAIAVGGFYWYKKRREQVVDPLLR